MTITELKNVKLLGLQWRLRFEHRDFAEAEGRLRMPLLGPQAAQFWTSGLASHMVGVLLYVGLLNREKALLAELYQPPEDPKLRRGWAPPAQMTMDDVRGLITYDNAAEVERVVMEAVADAFPRSTDDNEAKTEALEASPLAPESTGSDSGASLDSNLDSQRVNSAA